MNTRQPDKYLPLPPSPVVAEFAANVNPSGLRVLDVSCGRGNNSLYLAEHGFTDIVGMDDHPDMVMEARSRARLLAREQGAVACLFVETSLLDIDEPPASYDVVMAHQVLHALPKENRGLERFVHNLMRFTKPGGFNVVSTQVWTEADDNRQGKAHLLRPGELRAMYEASKWTTQHYYEEPTLRVLKRGSTIPARESIIARKRV